MLEITNSNTIMNCTISDLKDLLLKVNNNVSITILRNIQIVPNIIHDKVSTVDVDFKDEITMLEIIDVISKRQGEAYFYFIRKINNLIKEYRLSYTNGTLTYINNINDDYPKNGLYGINQKYSVTSDLLNKIAPVSLTSYLIYNNNHMLACNSIKHLHIVYSMFSRKECANPNILNLLVANTQHNYGNLTIEKITFKLDTKISVKEMRREFSHLKRNDIQFTEVVQYDIPVHIEDIRSAMILFPNNKKFYIWPYNKDDKPNNILCECPGIEFVMFK